MKKISSFLLPFKLETTKDKITPHAGLGIFGEFLYSQRISDAIDKFLPRSKRFPALVPLAIGLDL